jgi:heterodisulfide reductase subunit A
MPPDRTPSASAAGNAGKVLVAGAGIAGIRASLDLAALGCDVTLVDPSPAIGGILTKLDHQFPNDHCGMCRLLPEVGTLDSARFCLRKGLVHDRIRVLPHTRIQDVQGVPGSFHVQIRRLGRWLDAARCGDCPAPCVDVCPVSVPDEFNHGLTRRKAIHRPTPLGLPDTLTIDVVACTRCGACADVCPVDAIQLEAPDETGEIDADAIVLAAGNALVAPGAPGLDYLPTSDSVVTALEFERILGLGGPRSKTLVRPSDGHPVRHVAWLQCIGSRDAKHDRDACSNVCCMFALKQARLTGAIGAGEIETTVFYMDLRGSGKAWEDNLAATRRAGTRLVRSRVRDLSPAPDGGVRIRTLDEATGTVVDLHADLVVLSTGQKRSPDVADLAERFGWTLGSDRPSLLAPDCHTKAAPGVFLCGSVTGPADIASSVVGATATAGEVCRLLLGLGRSVGPSPSPPRREVDEKAKTLVVSCCCHVHGGRHTVSPAMVAGLSVEVRTLESPCLAAGADDLRALLRSTRQRRVVLGACRPHAQRRTLERLACEEGVDPAFVRVVSTGESVLALRMAVAALEAVEPARDAEMARSPLHARVLVVGGGLAGMRAALSLRDRGVEVVLVEARDELGGHFGAKSGEGTSEVTEYVAALRSKVLASAGVTVRLGAGVVASARTLEGWNTVVRSGSGTAEVIAHGATILATGGRAASTTSYGHGSCERVVTQTEFESRLEAGELGDPATVVMIQCVDSRQEGAHAYCSRVCCVRALRNAQRVQRAHPRARVFVLYRDMMTWGPWEQHYTRARKEGVVFTSYDVPRRPSVQVVAGRPVVTVADPILGQDLRIAADWVVLSTALEPSESAAELARVFGVERDRYGFLREADAKWRPVDLGVDGVYAAGVSHSPQLAGEVLVQAEAAAQRAYERLFRPPRTTPYTVANVRHALCARCGACVQACVYEARRLDASEDRIVVDPAACRSCGACVTACPNGATRLEGLGEKQVMAQLETALLNVPQGRTR